jgi:Ca2+-binding RTX toxin-like protein
MGRLPVLVALASLSVPVVSVLYSASDADAGPPVMCGGRVAGIVGTSGDDVLRGTPHADVIVGLGGHDRLQGGGDNDVLCGGPGPDSLSGGLGRNRMFGGGDHNILRSRGSGDAIRGGPVRDKIMLFGLADQVLGRAGDDQIINRRNDTLGRTVIHAGTGDDNIFNFGPEWDVFAGPGDDSLKGKIRPGAGEVLDGGSGVNDLSLGFDLNPTGSKWKHILLDLTRGRIDADGAVSRFSGQFGLLLVHGAHATSWTLRGTDGPDQIKIGTNQADVVVHGLAGDDMLSTGGGDDTIFGDAGLDQAGAGAGADTCFSIESPLAGSAGTNCETSTP